MMDFRKSLPSFKEKERLLQAIARNQVTIDLIGQFLQSFSNIMHFFLEKFYFPLLICVEGLFYQSSIWFYVSKGLMYLSRHYVFLFIFYLWVLWVEITPFFPLDVLSKIFVLI